MKLTVFTSQNILAKRMHPSGRWEAAANMYEGVATVTDVDGLQGLAYLIGGLDARQAIALGVITDGRQQAPITTRKALENGTAPVGAIMRGNESFELPQAGFLFIDVDDGSEPEQVLQHLEAFLPELAGVRWLALASSRHHVTNPQGKTVCRKGGWHLYAECAAGLHNLPALAKAYEAWAQANGHAHQQTNAGGASVWQYPVDTSVWKGAASRLIFESVLLPPGFKADRPLRWINPEGGALVIPHLAAVDRAPAAKQITAGAGKKKQGQARERDDHPAVAAYNAATDLEEVLERYGYRPLSSSGWATPEQSGASAGAHVYWGDPDTIYHFTSKSALAGKSCTAFDLLATYEYRGDRAAAFAAVRAKYMPAPADAVKRDNLDKMGEGARQAWLAWLAGGGLRYLGRCALLEGVEQRISASAWAAERNRPELVPEILQGMQIVCRRQFGGLHAPADWLERQHCTIGEAGALLVRGNASAFLQAPLGAGKTERALRPLVAAAGPVLIINHLRSLSGELASKMDAQHYLQGEPLREDRPLVTTIHSLGKWRVQQWIDEVAPTLVIIDEAAGVADVLGQPGGNMTDRDRLDALGTLEKLRQAGARFVLADGDVTPPARVLADMLGVSEWISAQGEYAQPAVAMHYATKTKGAPATTPLHDAIKGADALALFCDTKTEACAWEQMLPGALALHGSNTGETRQAAFLDAPDTSASTEGRIVYTSVLGAGVSVTSVERPVFAVYSGHLAPHTTWQALRRFRRVADGVIRVQVNLGAGRPRRLDAVTDAQEWLASWQEYRGIGGMGNVFDWLMAIRAAYCAMTDRWQQNPAAALRTYLEEAGVAVAVKLGTEGDGDEDHKLARALVKDAELEQFRTAARIDKRELARLQAAPRKTLADAAKERRAVAERNLHLTCSDFDADGNLPPKLAVAIMRGDLENTAKMAAHAWKEPETCMTQTAISTTGKGDHMLRRQLALATFGLVGVDSYSPEKPGAALVTAESAEPFLTTLDKILPRKGRLALLRELGLPALPTAKASGRTRMAWLANWLRGWGMESTGQEWARSAGGDRIRGSRWQINPMVAEYGKRIAAAENFRYGEMPVSRVAPGLEPGLSVPNIYPAVAAIDHQ